MVAGAASGVPTETRDARHAKILALARDHTPIYDCYEDEQNQALPQLDQQGGHFGTTPDSNGEIVYHYHMPACEVSTLHFAARNAIGRGKLGIARKLYVEAIKKSESSFARTFLLGALLEQRCGDIEKARMFFRIGSRIHPTDDRLHCAWGLMESKHGHPSDAVRHLMCAVRLNPTRHKNLLKWKGVQNVGQIKAHPSLLARIDFRMLFGEDPPAKFKLFDPYSTDTPDIKGGTKARQGSILNISPSIDGLSGCSTGKLKGTTPRTPPISKSKYKNSHRQWVAAETERLESEIGAYPGWKRKKTLLELDLICRL